MKNDKLTENLYGVLNYVSQVRSNLNLKVVMGQGLPALLLTCLTDHHGKLTLL